MSRNNELDTDMDTREIVSQAVYELDNLTTETLAAQMRLGTLTSSEVLEALAAYVGNFPTPPTKQASADSDPFPQVEAPEEDSTQES